MLRLSLRIVPVLMGFPCCFASTLATVTCANPNTTINQSNPVSASCSLEDAVYGSVGAIGTAAVGNLFVDADVNSVYDSPEGSAAASFDEVFAYSTTLTWQIDLSLLDLLSPGNEFLELGPVFLGEQQILAITMQFPNPGVFVETVPPGDWTFLANSTVFGEAGAQLSAVVESATTPEPASFVLVAPIALVLIGYWRRSLRTARINP
jgi:hypothetical protein